ncbi:MAG TPA: glycoside hydrolase [Agriterribacter sp.]|nr:glycoside hydrolase [Agriterribacter sp.]
MKTYFFYGLLFFSCLPAPGCSKKDNPSSGNHPPSANITSDLVKVNPFTYSFEVTANDQEFDPLTYTWDFGEGTVKQGTAKETFTYPPNKIYNITVAVSDGKSQPVKVKTSINTKVFTITADDSQKFQVMEGFGGFGLQREGWSPGPFTSPEFVNTLIDDLGLTILRLNIPSNFEVENDNSSPFVTDLTRYNVNNNTPGHDDKLADHIQYLKDMKAAGLQKVIASVWTPPIWMKYNNKVGNGTTDQNSAPPYTNTPDATTNQLKTDMYDEFAEYCVAYIKTIKQLTGIDIYALSIQNEPRFSQFYVSCVYNGEAMRDLLKVVGKRFEDESIATKLFVPEDVGFFDGIKSLVDPVLADAGSRKYVDILAVHGYATDGVNPGSADAKTWEDMYNWGAPYDIPLWMTETSGYENTLDGAIALSKAMYIALQYGNVSAWLFWSLSTTQLDAYSLMSAGGEKSKRYFVSKNFYRYIRPGAQRFKISSDDEHLLPLAFTNTNEQSNTIVIINDDITGKPVRLSGTGLANEYSIFATSADHDCKAMGSTDVKDVVLIPAKGVVTLYKK